MSKMHCFSILFVCQGNTCRSPMAESIMRSLCEELKLNWKVDSAALRNWNVGRRPDNRCVRVLQENGLSTKHYARLVSPNDFMSFDLILAINKNNVKDLTNIAGTVGKGCKAKIDVLSSYLNDSESGEIPDPFFSKGLKRFRMVYKQITNGCQNFIKTQRDYIDTNYPQPMILNC